jgi:tripartite-type tricarboxylate transporter receptor subunit TctC
MSGDLKFHGEFAGSTKEGLMSNSERRKTKIETPPIVSKSRRTERHLDGSRLHGHPLRVNATNLPRRQLLHLAASAAALPAVSRIAEAQTYPIRPVRIIVGFAAGGVTDIVARLTGQWLSQRLGQQFIVENRPGAGGNTAAEAVVGAPPDGYTLLIAASSDAINSTVYKKLNFNFIRDTVPIARIAYSPLVMVVAPQFPAKTVPEFIAYAKANPGKLNLGTAGFGTPIHVVGELFKMTAGLDLAQVHYRGEAPALADLLGQQIDAVFATLSGSIAYVRANQLRALAVMSATRSPELPKIPVMADFVPGLEASAWSGIVAPKNTPAEIIVRLNTAVNAALADPTMKTRFVEIGATVFPGSPAEFGKFIADDTEKMAKVVKFAGIEVN